MDIYSIKFFKLYCGVFHIIMGLDSYIRYTHIIIGLYLGLSILYIWTRYPLSYPPT